MPVQFGFSIQLRTLTHWSTFSFELLIGLLVASRWNPSSYCWSKSSVDCLKELKWPSIHQHHTYFSICQVYDIFHNRNSISFSDHFHLSKVHPLNIRPASSTINSYRYSFLLTVLFVEYNSIQHPKDYSDQSIPLCPVSFSFLTIVCMMCLYIYFVIVSVVSFDL